MWLEDVSTIASPKCSSKYVFNNINDITTHTNHWHIASFHRLAESGCWGQFKHLLVLWNRMAQTPASFFIINEMRLKLWRTQREKNLHVDNFTKGPSKMLPRSTTNPNIDPQNQTPQGVPSKWCMTRSWRSPHAIELYFCLSAPLQTFSIFLNGSGAGYTTIEGYRRPKVHEIQVPEKGHKLSLLFLYYTGLQKK